MNAPTRAAASLLSMVLLLTLALAGNHAAEAVTSPQQAFINKVAEPARSAQRSSGVPASVLIAQAIDASDWGDSKPATSAKNYFDTQCSSSMTAKQFGALARAQLGKPYVLGAEASITNPDPPKFDCSELVEWLYGRSGNRITDLAAAQYNVTKAVKKGTSPKVGDLVFLRNNPARSNGIGHVAVLTAKKSNGDWEIVEARGRAWGVVKTTLSYWKQRKYYAGLRRYAKLTFAGSDGVVASAAARFQNGCVTIASEKYSKYASITDSFKAQAEAIAEDSAYAKARAVMGNSSAFIDALAKAERPKSAAAYAKKLKALIADYRLSDYDVVPFTVVLLSGDSGPKVTAAQYLLRAAGHSVTVTGKYDAATVKTVKKFQKAKKLEADGEAGPKTLGALAKTIKSGATGDRVRALHALLGGLGHTVSGAAFGSATASAVKSVQSLAGRNQTGVADPNTWAALFMTLAPAPAPKISGTAEVGEKLTATAGTWGPGKPALSYQWYRAGNAIAGATKAAYTVELADAGAALSVAVTGRKAPYTTTIRRSAATEQVPLVAFEKTAAPTVTGTAKVGQKLTAKAGTWKPAAARVSYQWYRGTTAIKGATASGYTAQAADAGATLSVRVTGSSTGYVTVTKASKATAKVAKGDLTAAKVAISGKAKAGSTLRADPGDWAPDGVAFAYQWYRGKTAIKGATAASYKLVKADAGKKVKVVVRGSKAGYATLQKKVTVTIAK